MQVRATWQHWESSVALFQTTRRVVTINLDETPIPYWFESRGLHYSPQTGHLEKAQSAFGCAHALSRKRKYCSHVALICDDQKVQPLLPQVLMVNQRHVTQQDAFSVRQDLDSNVILWRKHSAWASAADIVDIIALLAYILEPFSENVDVVLVMDCCPSHTHQMVQAAVFFLDSELVLLQRARPGLCNPSTRVFFVKRKDCSDTRGQDNLCVRLTVASQ